MTISNGGVLPRIHPELLSKKRGGKVKVETQVTVPEKRANRKPIKKPSKKSKGKPGRKPKVSTASGDWGHTYVALVLCLSVRIQQMVLYAEKHREWQRSRCQHNSGRRTGRGIYYSLCEKLVPWTKGGIAVLITHYQEFVILRFTLTLKEHIINVVYFWMQGTFSNIPTYN